MSEQPACLALPCLAWPATFVSCAIATDRPGTDRVRAAPYVHARGHTYVSVRPSVRMYVCMYMHICCYIHTASRMHRVSSTSGEPPEGERDGIPTASPAFLWNVPSEMHNGVLIGSEKPCLIHELSPLNLGVHHTTHRFAARAALASVLCSACDRTSPSTSRLHTRTHTHPHTHPRVHTHITIAGVQERWVGCMTPSAVGTDGGDRVVEHDMTEKHERSPVTTY